MTVDDLIDEQRCTAVRDGRRCQLWANHAAAWGEFEHAVYWRPERKVSPGAPPGRLLPGHLLLWSEAGAREVEPGSVRLHWAAMGHERG